MEPILCSRTEVRLAIFRDRRLLASYFAEQWIQSGDIVRSLFDLLLSLRHRRLRLLLLSLCSKQSSLCQCQLRACLFRLL
jgi:hypothetical protein